MSVSIMGAALDRGPRKGPMRSLLIAIANAADDFGFACPGIELLAKSCCCDERTVIRNSAQLEQEGWMRIERKVLGGRGNVYFINLQKLDVVPTSTARRSPLWADMQRLMKALNSGDKLYRKGGRLKFERPAVDGGKALTGDLFADKNSGDILSPEFGRADEPNGGQIDRIAAIASVSEDEAADEATEERISGDKMSPVTRHPRHLTGDISSRPFNSLTVTQPLPNREAPQPPQAGESGLSLPGQGNGGELVLPDPGVRPGDPAFALNVGLASRWVLRRCGISNSRMEKHITAALTTRMESFGDSLADSATLAVTTYAEYQAALAAGDLRFGPWAVSRFFGEGYWLARESWPWTPEAQNRRHAAVGALDASPEAKARRAAADAAELERKAAWIETNAKAVTDLNMKYHVGELAEIAYGLQAAAGSLRDGTPLDRVDQRLQALEDAMIITLIATVPEAKAAADTVDQHELLKKHPHITEKGMADALVSMRRRRVCDAVDAPFLSLFYMPAAPERGGRS